MFCSNCGAQCPDGAVFCTSCGAQLGQQGAEAAIPSAGAPAAPVGNAQPYYAPVTPKAPKQKNPKTKKIVIGVVVGVLVLAAIVTGLILLLTRPETINLNEYLKFEADGYDGYGEVRASIDWEAIEKKYGDEIEFSDEAKDAIGLSSSQIKRLSPITVLSEVIDVDLDKRYDCANGEQIAYKWDVPKKLEEAFNVKFEYEKGTYTVSGLKEVETFDPFEHLTVSFSGISSDGSCEIEYDGEIFNSWSFTVDPQYDLSNGDTVTISLDSYSDDEYLVEEYGKLPSVREKEYTVTGLVEYVNSYSELTEDFLTNAQSEAEDQIYSFFAQYYGSEAALSDLTSDGYLFGVTNEDYYSSYNELYLIYRGTVTEGDEAPYQMWFPVHFLNILSEADGMSYEEIRGIGAGWSSSESFTNPVSAWNEIMDYGDSMDWEAGGGFERFETNEKLDSLSKISADQQTAFQEMAKAEIESYLADAYSFDSSVSELTYAGEILLMPKSEYSSNRLYVVLSAQVTSGDEDFEETTVYYPVRYDDISVIADGECFVEYKNGIAGYSYFPDTWYSTKGYTDPADLYNDIVTQNRNSYSYELSEELKQLEN